MLYGCHIQMKTVKTPFLKRGSVFVCVVEGGCVEQDLDSAQFFAQNERMCYKSACRSCPSFFWINVLIHSLVDKQLHLDFTLIYLLIHASNPTPLGQMVKKQCYSAATALTVCVQWHGACLVMRMKGIFLCILQHVYMGHMHSCIQCVRLFVFSFLLIIFLWTEYFLWCQAPFTQFAHSEICSSFSLKWKSKLCQSCHPSWIQLIRSSEMSAQAFHVAILHWFEMV